MSVKGKAEMRGKPLNEVAASIKDTLLSRDKIESQVKRDLGKDCDVKEVSRIVDLIHRGDDTLGAEKRRRAAVETAKVNQKKYDQVLKEMMTTEDIVNSVISYIKPTEPLPPVYAPPSVVKSREAAVLLLSDLHIGERVLKTELTPTRYKVSGEGWLEDEPIESLGSFSTDIAMARMENLVDSVKSLIYLQRNTSTIDDLYIFGIGDYIAGHLHNNNNSTNDIDVNQQVVIGSWVLSQVIRDLAPHFNTITMFMVDGNHDRTTDKIVTKSRNTLARSYLMGHMVKTQVSSIPNVRVLIPNSPNVIVSIGDWNYLVQHGDTIRGWAGIPYYGIDRHTKNWSRIASSKGLHIHQTCIGHFHTAGRLNDWILNGSLKGGDEFALNNLKVNSHPAQILFGVHKDREVSFYYHIDFKDCPEEPNRYKTWKQFLE